MADGRRHERTITQQRCCWPALCIQSWRMKIGSEEGAVLSHIFSCSKLHLFPVHVRDDTYHAMQWKVVHFKSLPLYSVDNDRIVGRTRLS